MERRRRSTRVELPLEAMGKPVRRREKPRERWLLTRKTWKYMADAGRRLIPDGAQNRIEDVPRIEAYFQEVCSKEPRFLLWRKSSYPGALPRPKRKKRARGGSVRARSPSDEASPQRPTDLYALTHTSGGRFDMAKMKRDFLAAPMPRIEPSPPPPRDLAAEEECTVLEMLRKYLKIEEDEGVGRTSDADELVRALKRLLARRGDKEVRQAADSPSGSSGSTHPSLLDQLGRYYSRSPNRDHIVQDLLTDRSLLKKLYHDLRKTKPYRGGSGSYGGGTSSYTGGGYSGTAWRSRIRSHFVDSDCEIGPRRIRSSPTSPPPLIEVRGESEEESRSDRGTQTNSIPDEVLQELRRQYRDKNESTAPTSPSSPPPGDKARPRRRSSVDHDDVSPSVSDTIMRYLRMARKKDPEGDKVDRFKRINYDKNLRNIKARERSEFEDDAINKGCQGEEDWILTFVNELSSVPLPTCSNPSSPSAGSAHVSFMSTLRNLTAATPASSAGGMQKSRSSSSVVQSVGRRIWRTRSRSSSRIAPSSWTPQGSCAWTDGCGRAVRLSNTSLLTLSEVERRALQQAALARIKQLNLGCSTPIRIPEDSVPVASKPKRRPYVLKKKSLTTGFFEQKGADKDKDGGGCGGGSVFGVPLSQCVESERALRRQQLGSRSSLASLNTLERERGDDSESCDSGDWGSGSSSERLQWRPGGSAEEAAGASGPRVPALVSACLAHLRTHGLHTVGLFRVSSAKKRVRQLREEWERGGCSGAEAMSASTCPHDVASLLKEFLRDLPDPLLCRDLYSAFLQTQKIRNRSLQLEALKLLVQLLPAAHRDTLSALLSFLSQLAAHAEDDKYAAGNKMDAANLATVFAPNILHRNKPGETTSADQISRVEQSDVINVVRLLIEKQAELWTLPADLLHEAYINLAETAPAHLDTILLRRAECAAERVSAPSGEADSEHAPERRVWSREECLHGGAATGGPDRDVPSRGEIRKSRRMRDLASDASTGSVSSTMTIVTRVRGSIEECGSSGVVCSPPPASATPRTDSTPDSADSASDYNETVGGSDEDSCPIITASLHIPATFGRESTSPGAPRRSPAAPPRRRRSTSGSDSSNKRDSAVGSGTTPSSPASWTSSPPSSPPPAPVTPVRVTLTSAGEIRRRQEAVRHAQTTDIDRYIGLGREKNTSDERAVVLRQRDGAAPPVTLYKRGELISSVHRQQ